MSWTYFEKDFLGHLFSRELKEVNIHEFLTLKKYSLSVHEYGLKFTKLPHYDPKMVNDIRSKMSLLVARLGNLSRK